MKNILFIDRDGTLICEAADEQIDQIDKLRFYPGAITYMCKIATELDYTLILVTNQDGLGTDNYPEKVFWPLHKLIMDTFKNEGVVFEQEFIDRTFAKDLAPTRKPGTALLSKLMEEGFNMENSFVIGDRLNDVILAKNLGIKALWLRNSDALGTQEGMAKADSLKEQIALQTQSWEDIYHFLLSINRKTTHQRTTKETHVQVELMLDGTGKATISTGLNFLDHMLDQIARHGGVDLSVTAKGDLHVDEHHTVEDTAITLGEAFGKALGNKLGIERYGFCLPMDDCLATAALDFGGRSWLVWDAEFKRERIGDVPTELFFHFFKSFSEAAKCNLNISASGINEHHKIEAIFKAFAKAIQMAVRQNKDKMILPSTKGAL